MLIKRLQASGLLSFGPSGIDLPLRELNVLVGPNGSGKSNLVEGLALFQATPGSFPRPLEEAGGVGEWLWKGKPPAYEAVLDAEVMNPNGRMDLRHVLAIRELGGGFAIADERIENVDPHPGQKGAYYFYNYRRGRPQIKDYRWEDVDDESPQRRELSPTDIRSGASILAQVRDPDPHRYPAIRRLQDAYASIRIYRNWTLGPGSPLRRPQVASGPSDIVAEDLSNYQRVVWNLRKAVLEEMLEYLSALYEGAEDFHLDPLGDTVLLSVREKGIGYVPVTRLSDGTLRYLCLLAILLNPSPPELTVIDEPDLGLHPDLMPTLAKLLLHASQRGQVIVTTHSRALVDAFTDQPEVVVTCGKNEDGTYFERLDAGDLKQWLEKYSLGQLWSRGDIGGNRW